MTNDKKSNRCDILQHNIRTKLKGIEIELDSRTIGNKRSEKAREYLASPNQGYHECMRGVREQITRDLIQMILLKAVLT